MANFATVEDLATYTQRDFSAEETATADQMLAVVTGEIKAYTGQFLEVQTGVVDRFRGANVRILLLSQVPVNTVTAFTVDGDAFTDYDLNSKAGIITRTDSDWLTWYSNELVLVTYNSGYSPIDPALKGVCLSYAARLMASPVAGTTSEAIGTYSVQYGTAGNRGFDDIEQAVLDRFRAK